MASEQLSTGYIWYAHTGVVYPHVYRALATAQQAAEAEYRKRDKAQYPNAAPQALTWLEKTNPRLPGFAKNRFWKLYAERRPSSRRTAYAEATFDTNYGVSELEVEP
jgi:hypothetical protein